MEGLRINNELHNIVHKKKSYIETSFLKRHSNDTKVESRNKDFLRLVQNNDNFQSDKVEEIKSDTKPKGESMVRATTI